MRINMLKKKIIAYVMAVVLVTSATALPMVSIKADSENAGQQDSINVDEITDWVLLSGISKDGTSAYVSESILDTFGYDGFRGFYDAGETPGYHISDAFEAIDVFGFVTTGGRATSIIIDNVEYQSDDENVLIGADCVYINQDLLKVNKGETKYFMITAKGTDVGNDGTFVLKIKDSFGLDSVEMPDEDDWKEVTDGDGAVDGSRYYVPDGNNIIGIVCELKNIGSDIKYLDYDNCTVTGPAYGFSTNKYVKNVWINGERITNSEELFVTRDIIVISQSMFEVQEEEERIFYITFSDANRNVYTYPLKVVGKIKGALEETTNAPTEPAEETSNEPTGPTGETTNTPTGPAEETTNAPTGATEEKTTLKKKNNAGRKTIGKSKIKSLKEMSYHSVKIIWGKTEGATSYAIYRSEKKNGKYKLIKNTKKLMYTDKKVKAGSKYFYRIKAINVIGDSTVSKTASIMVKGTPKTPNIKVSKTSTSWSIVWGTIKDNSKGIEIYMKNGQGKYKKYTLINKTTKLKKSKKKKGVTGIISSIGTLQPNIVYKFRVRTYAVVKGKKVYSKWSKVKTLKK